MLCNTTGQKEQHSREKALNKPHFQLKILQCRKKSSLPGGVCKDLKEMQLITERSPTFSFPGMEGVLLAAFSSGSIFSRTGGFKEVSQNGEISWGAEVETEVVVSFKTSEGENKACCISQNSR